MASPAVPVGSRHRNVRAAVMAEAFNLCNTENYAGYFGVQNDAAGKPRPDFGTPSGISATRQFQIVVLTQGDAHPGHDAQGA